jgi:hypothetical protein
MVQLLAIWNLMAIWLLLMLNLMLLALPTSPLVPSPTQQEPMLNWNLLMIWIPMILTLLTLMLLLGLILLQEA